MTLIDTLVSAAISALVFAALAAAVMVMMRTAPAVQNDVAEAHDVEQLMRYLPSDIASTPAAIGQFSTDPNAVTGCNGAGADDGTNVLRLESTEIASGAAVAISYRIVPVAGGATTMVRVRCEGPDQASLGPAEIISVADELDVVDPVEVEVVDDGTVVQRVSMTMTGTSGQRRLVSGIPSVAGAGLPPASTTTTTTTTTIATTTTAVAPTTTAGPTTTVAGPTTTAAGPTTTAAGPTTTGAAATTTAATTTTAAPVCSTNPFRTTGGFAAFVSGALHLGGGDSYGPIAAGGDLSFGSYLVTPRSTSIGFKASGETLVTGLLVGGQINWGASALIGTLTVKDTPVHVGNFSNGVKGLTLGSETKLLEWPGVNLLRLVNVTGLVQPLSGTNGIQRPGLIDFAAASTSLRTAATDLATLPGSCTGAASMATFGVNGVGAWSGSGPVWLEYAANKVNVLNSNVAQLEGMTNVNKTVASAPASASTTLLINVPDAGVIDFTPPIWTQNEPRYVIWNFPNATQLTISGPLWGSLLAPKAAVISNADLRGNVIASSLRINAGSLDWDRRYAGSFPWDPWVQP